MSESFTYEVDDRCFSIQSLLWDSHIPASGKTTFSFPPAVAAEAEALLCCLAGLASSWALSAAATGIAGATRDRWRRLKDDPAKHERHKLQNREAARRYKARLREYRARQAAHPLAKRS